MTHAVASHSLLIERFALLDGIRRNLDSTQEAINASVQRVYERAQFLRSSLPSADKSSIEGRIESKTTETCSEFPSLHESKGEEEKRDELTSQGESTTPPAEESVSPDISAASRLQRLFTLDDNQKFTLRVMWSRWHLGPDISLLLLFGVDIYNTMKSLDFYWSPPKLDPILSSFAFQMYNILSMSLGQDILKNDVSVRDKVLEQLMTGEFSVVRQLRDQLQQQKSIAGSIKNLIKIQKKISSFQEVLGIVKRIDATLGIFEKVLRYGPELLNNSLKSFSNSMADHPWYASHTSTIGQLGVYADFCASMTKAAYGQGEVSIDHSCFCELSRACKEMKGRKSLTVEDVEKVKGILNNAFATVSKVMCDKIWTMIREEDESKSIGKEQEEQQKTEVKDRRNSQYLVLDSLLARFQNIFEEQVSDDFPLFSSEERSWKRLVANMSLCPSEVPQHIEIEPPPNFSIDFNAGFCTFIAPIEEIFVSLINNPAIQSVKDILSETGSENSYSPSFSLAHLHGLVFVPALFDPIKQMLAIIPDQLKKFLETQLESTGTLRKENKEVVASYIQDVCFRQSLFLARVVMLLEDINTLLTRRVILSSEKHQSLPQELINIMYLSGLDELLSRLLPSNIQEEIEEKPLPLPETVAAGEDLEPKEAEEKPQSTPMLRASVEADALRPRPPQSHRPARQTGEPTEKANALLDLKGATKIKHIIGRLEKAGFRLLTRRGHGSHRIYKRPGGPQAIFSYHALDDEVKPGIIRSIKQQVEALPQHPQDNGKAFPKKKLNGPLA